MCEGEIKHILKQMEGRILRTFLVVGGGLSAHSIGHVSNLGQKSMNTNRKLTAWAPRHGPLALTGNSPVRHLKGKQETEMLRTHEATWTPK